MMMYRDPTLDVDQMKSTMRHICLDYLPRNSNTNITARGVAMTAASTCNYCGKRGHYARNCWKRKDGNDSKSTGSHDTPKGNDSSKSNAISKDTAVQKLCSVHKTISHSDDECDKHGAPRPPQSGRAQTASALLGTSTCLSNDDEKMSLNFDDDLGEGFPFTGLLAGSRKSGFHPNSEGSR